MKLCYWILEQHPMASPSKHIEIIWVFAHGTWNQLILFDHLVIIQQGMFSSGDN